MTHRNASAQRRFRANHRRIDYVPKPEVLEAIEQHRLGGLSNTFVGVLDHLIVQGHKAITGNGKVSAGALNGTSARSAVRRLTPLQEQFCLAFVSGNQSLTSAYRQVYCPRNSKPATVNKMAAELAALPHIAARIQALRESVASSVIERTAYSMADAMREAGEIFEEAITLRQAGAAVAAVTLRARLAGLLNSSSDRGSRGWGSRPDLMQSDVEALRNLLADVKARLASGLG